MNHFSFSPFQIYEKAVTLGEVCHDEAQLHSLKQLEEEFPQRFMRIHRSYLVASDRVQRLENTDDGVILWLRGSDHPLPVSRRHAPGVKKHLRGC